MLLIKMPFLDDKNEIQKNNEKPVETLETIPEGL